MPKNLVKIIGISAAIISIYYIVKFIFCKDFYPTDQDETPYIGDALIFAKINSLKTGAMVGETVSAIFQADWYGIFYPLFFGFLFKLSDSYKIFIYFNIFSLAFIIIFYWRSFRDISQADKIYAVTLFLISPATIYYLFFYMPLLLNSVFSLTLTYILYKFQNDILRNKKKYIYSFIALTLFASLFRSIFIFWLIGLLPFSSNRKELIRNILIFLGGYLFITLYTKWFTAIYYSSFKALTDFDLYWFINNAIKSIRSNLINVILVLPPTHLFINYYLLFIFPVLLVFTGYKQKNKFVSSIGLISLFTIASCFLIYKTYWYYLIRVNYHLIFPLFIAFVISVRSVIYRNVLLISLLFVYFITIKNNIISSAINERNTMAEKIKNDAKDISLSEIKFHVSDSLRDLTTILIHTDFFENPTELMMSVPFISANNKLIRYTVNRATPDPPLKRYGKLEINYLLIPSNINTFDDKIVFQTPYYKLCASR